MTTESPEKFMGKVTPEPTSGCWLWVGYTDTQGYARFWNGRRYERAHRWSFKMFVGAIPKGRVIDHLCRVRSCVNPLHLEAVTNEVNVLRGEGTSAVNKRKTHCIRGHSFAEHGGRQRKGRKCLLCEKAYFKERRARLSAAPVDGHGVPTTPSRSQAGASPFKEVE